MFQHLHAAYDSLARVVGRQHPALVGRDPPEKDQPKGGKQLQMGILSYETLAARALMVYKANAAEHSIRSEAAVWLADVLQQVSPAFRPTTQDLLQEEQKRQATALEEDIRHLRLLLAVDGKPVIKHFWRRNAHGIVQRRKAFRGTIKVEAPRPLRLRNGRDPNTQTLLTEEQDVMAAVRAILQELYGKRQEDLPSFQAVLCHHMPQVPEGQWAQV